jgi:hypothetical protein
MASEPSPWWWSSCVDGEFKVFGEALGGLREQFGGELGWLRQQMTDGFDRVDRELGDVKRDLAEVKRGEVKVDLGLVKSAVTTHTR